MRVGILEKLPILHTKLAIFGPLVCMLRMQISQVMLLLVRKKRGGQDRFQIIKYFESDYLALLSDNRANEVASCRY